MFAGEESLSILGSAMLHNELFRFKVQILSTTASV